MLDTHDVMGSMKLVPGWKGSSGILMDQWMNDVFCSWNIYLCYDYYVDIIRFGALGGGGVGYRYLMGIFEHAYVPWPSTCNHVSVYFSFLFPWLLCLVGHVNF